MNGAASWFGSGAGLIAVGVSWTVLRFLHHGPSWAHPWLHRFAIIGMWVGGSALALTVVGQWIISVETWAAGLIGGITSGTGHAVIVITGLILAISVIVALIWVPAPAAAYLALMLPFVLALTGGHEHQLLNMFPGSQFAQQISTWLGG